MHVSPVNFKTLAYVLEVEGHDAARVLARAGFDALHALDDQGPWLPLERFARLMEAVLDCTGDACFGLVAGKSKGLMRYVTLVQVTLVAPTLRQVIDSVNRFAPLYLERSEMALVEGDGLARIEVEPVVTTGRAGQFRHELVAMSAFQAVGFARGGPGDIVAIEFPYDCPAGQAPRYEAAFGPKLRFGARRCAITFNPALLDAPLQTHDPLAWLAAHANAEAALSALRAAHGTGERVRRWLASSLPVQPSFGQTARHLRLTERSLRHRLAAAGLTHAELARQCQQALAQQLLADRALPLKRVAERVGFASAASFHRAFRRWTDMTPGEWRGLAMAGEIPSTRGQ